MLKKYLQCIPLLLCSCSSILPEAQTDETTTVSFIDVGQGDASLIQCENKSFLIDTGPQDGGVTNFLINQNLDTIDALIITHAHADHYGSLFELQQKFFIRKIYTSGPSDKTPEWKAVLAFIQQNHILLDTLQKGSNLGLCPNTSIYTFWPPREHSFTENDASLVFKLQTPGWNYLFTGDLEKSGEDSLLEICPQLKSNILKVAHHGSKTSSQLDFLACVQPQNAIISVGKANDHGHPHPEVLADLYHYLDDSNSLFRTDLQGSIQSHTGFSQFQISPIKNQLDP